MQSFAEKFVDAIAPIFGRLSDPWTLFLLAIQTYLAYLSFSIIWRLFLSPLRIFPGPRLAALSRWYQFKYDFIDDGGFVDHLEKLHMKYGPIVRIGPNELHFSEPSAYHSIYNHPKFTKDPRYYQAFAEDLTAFGTCDVQFHKMRKDVMSPLFSRRSILRLEHVIQEKVDLLLNRAFSYKDTPISLSFAFQCTALDVITDYCFAEPVNALAANFFQSPFLIAMKTALPIISVFKYFPFLQFIINGLPDWLAVILNPSSRSYFELCRTLSNQIDALVENPALLERADHEIIYHHLLTPQPSKGQNSIPSKRSLMEEATNMVFAGSDNVGNTCTVGTFHILKNEQVYATLVRELEEAWPDKDSPMRFNSLEKLPYLTAVIKESLRMSNGIVSPMPRIVGPRDTNISGVTVPSGTIVSIGAPFVHADPTIFPNPSTFDPDRWLRPDSRQLENYLVSFSRGPRSCLGINLAWCELYLIFANVFRHAEIEIHNTTIEDFRYRSYFLPLYRGKQFHARVKRRN